MNALKEFQTIPGIGNSLSQDLVDLGYRKVNELYVKAPDGHLWEVDHNHHFWVGSIRWLKHLEKQAGLMYQWG